MTKTYTCAKCGRVHTVDGPMVPQGWWVAAHGGRTYCPACA